MSSLAQLLLRLVGPIVARVLAALGLSLLTVKGADIAVDRLKTIVVEGANGLPSQALSLFLLAGGGVALNMIFGAITFRVVYWGLSKGARMLGAAK